MKDMSVDKHQLRGPGKKYVTASENAQKLEKGKISESKSKVRNAESEKYAVDLNVLISLTVS